MYYIVLFGWPIGLRLNNIKFTGILKDGIHCSGNTIQQ